MRLLGKRQISELEPSELVVTIIISEVASFPIQDTSQPLLTSIMAIALILILEILLSFGAYKSLFIRKLIYGVPSVFFENGKINEREMERQRFNLNDLMETIRNTGAATLSEVEYVIMETNGSVSVIPKTQHRPLTLSDIGKADYSHTFISYVLIDGGRINENNLKKLGFDQNWLKKQLEVRKIKKASEVFCMTADKTGEIVIIPYQKKGQKK